MTFEQFKNTNEIRIVVEVSNVCNFKCNYCQVSTKQEKNIFVDLDLFAHNLKRNISILAKDITIDITGNSEPTLHPYLFNFCKSLQNEKNIVNILVCTNLSCSIDKIKQLIAIDKLRFVATMHLSQLKLNEINQMLRKLLFLAKNNKLDSCIVMLEPKKVNDAFMMFKQIQRFLPNNCIQMELCLPISLYHRNDLVEISKIPYYFNTNICDKDCINSKILCYIKYDMAIYMCYALRYNNTNSSIRFSNDIILKDLLNEKEYINQCRF